MQLFFISVLLQIVISKAAVAPPPWADPKYNPCATQRLGWQMLYWPPDGKCYRIFQIGYPCPDGMELTPGTIFSSSEDKQVTAECRCPPQTAQYAQNGNCYELFTIGPCDIGFYFALDTRYSDSRSEWRWGTCKQIKKCPNKNEIFWPQDDRCYLYLTKGPCPSGQLITLGLNKIAACKCNYRYEMRRYWSTGNGCFEHFTRGPCKETGQLFLPDRSCGCHKLLPHYHNGSKLCYEIGTIGPCNSGELFQLDSSTQRANCECKNGHIRYEKNSNCYRPYTQGPCEPGFILINTTTCIKQPCERGYLYYPLNNSCYRIGSKGPCKTGYVLTFDFETRPSTDGISYNGVCQCRQPNDKNTCVKVETTCENNSAVVLYNNRCFKLYSQGPCPTGAWLTLKRQGRELWGEKEGKEGVCECIPGYKNRMYVINEQNVTQCIPPAVTLAEFLNKNIRNLSYVVRLI